MTLNVIHKFGHLVFLLISITFVYFFFVVFGIVETFDEDRGFGFIKTYKYLVLFSIY